MKAIVSLFISAYQPGMAKHRMQTLFPQPVAPAAIFSRSDGLREAGGYRYKVYEDKGCEGKYFEDQSFEEPDFEDTSYEDICWMISRAQRRQPLDYFYANNHSRQFATTHRITSDLKGSLSTF